MEELLSQITNSFDLPLMVSITVLTYITLKIVDKFVLKTKKVLKHSITFIVTILLSLVYYFYLKMPLEKIIPTYLLSTAFYDMIIRQIIDRFNLGYKKEK